MQPADLNVIKEIPGYKVILKTVLKTQIQQLVEQLADHTGEESVILTASVSDGTLSHLGSDSGKVFLEDHDDIKTQFLGFCLKRHHKQKQLEKEKQQQQESLMESANRLLSMPTTPTRYGTGMRPRFTPTRVPPSPRQQFSPRFQTSPRQSFSSPNQGRIQSSPRLQPVPLTGVSPQGTQRVGQSNVRHEPYPATRPRRPALNFNQQGRNPNLNQKKPTSTMKLPTEPQNVKKINIDPNEVIKIEAADEDEEIQIKTKPPERQLSCETGIKIASVSGATEISTASTAGSAVTTDTNKSSISQASVVEPSISRAPSISSAPSPSHSSQPVSPTTMPVLSPIPKEENSSSSASTIVNDSSDTKISDNAPLEGLSLGSDLSKLTGIPTKTPKTEGLESPSAASTSTVSQDSSSGNGQSVKVKVEATGESEMELQITGIEPGQMTHGQSNQVPDLQNRMGFGPSTSGMSDVGDVMGPQMNPEYKSPVGNLTEYTVRTHSNVGNQIVLKIKRSPVVKLVRLKLPSAVINQKGSVRLTHGSIEGGRLQTILKPQRRYNSVKKLICYKCKQRFFLKYTLKLHLSKCYGKKQQQSKGNKIGSNSQNDEARNSSDEQKTKEANLITDYKNAVDCRKSTSDGVKPSNNDDTKRAGFVSKCSDSDLNKQPVIQYPKTSSMPFAKDYSDQCTKTSGISFSNEYPGDKCPKTARLSFTGRPMTTIKEHQLSKQTTMFCGLASKGAYTTKPHILKHSVEPDKETSNNIESKSITPTSHRTASGVASTPYKGKYLMPGYLCLYCRKCFKSTAHLRDHLRTHTKERPFSCDQCNKRFSQKSNLMTHIKKFHL